MKLFLFSLILLSINIILLLIMPIHYKIFIQYKNDVNFMKNIRINITIFPLKVYNKKYIMGKPIPKKKKRINIPVKIYLRKESLNNIKNIVLYLYYNINKAQTDIGISDPFNAFLYNFSLNILLSGRINIYYSEQRSISLTIKGRLQLIKLLIYILPIIKIELINKPKNV